MTVTKITELTVYETPDGGRTVYARRAGQKTRELHYQDPALKDELIEVERQRRWQELYTARKTNPALNEMCEKAELFYALLKTDE
jgi:hypothetical protein